MRCRAYADADRSRMPAKRALLTFAAEARGKFRIRQWQPLQKLAELVHPTAADARGDQPAEGG
jgi:hypothetical protein